MHLLYRFDIWNIRKLCLCIQQCVELEEIKDRRTQGGCIVPQRGIINCSSHNKKLGMTRQNTSTNAILLNVLFFILNSILKMIFTLMRG